MLHGVKRYLSKQAMCSMVNAYLHSVTDYCIDIWTVQTDDRLHNIQSRIDNFLCCYYFPKLAKQKCNRKLSYTALKNSIDIVNLRSECNFLTLKERSDFVILKTAFKFYQEGKLSISERSKVLCKSMPTLNVLSPRTECLKRSIDFKIIQLWNNLPTKWNINNMSYSNFCNNVKLLIIKKRESKFV
jgi:hypothetical protein